MNKTTSIIRIIILLTFLCLGIFLLFGEETDQNVVAWALHVIADKVLAFGSFYIFGKLYNRWSAIDPVIGLVAQWSEQERRGSMAALKDEGK